jgi:anti-sigma regulatory factor (Ser/Thr protein kinase)
LAGELSLVVMPELLADAVAVVAELVGNAIRHARALPGDVIRVAWRIRAGVGGEWLEIRVTDGGAGDGPRQRDAAVDAVDGRGLAIVDALADTWGVDRDGLGQSVWAQLSRPYPAGTRSQLHAAPVESRIPSENRQSLSG